MQSLKNDGAIRLIRINLILGLVEGILVTFLLLAIPSERENAGILGFSNTRIFFLSFLVFGILTFLVLSIKSFMQTGWVHSLINYLDKNANDKKLKGFYLITAALFFAASGSFLLVWTSQIADKSIRGYFVRLSPIVFWITALGLQGLFLLIKFGYGHKFSLKNFRMAYVEFKTWIKSTNLYVLMGIVIVFIGITFSAVFSYFPSYRHLFIDEDQFLENCTTVVFLLCFLLSIFMLFKSKQRRLTALLIPVTSIWAFLEEISYGQSFSAKTPTITPKNNVDGLHDYFKIYYKLAYQNISSKVDTFVMYFMISLLLLGLFLILRYVYKNYLVKHLSVNDPLFFIMISGSFILIGLLLDLEYFKSDLVIFIEELSEFFSALALFFGSIAIYQNMELEKESKAEKYLV